MQKNSIREMFFYIGIIVQFIMVCFLITIQEIPHSIVFVVAIVGSFGIKIFLTKYTKKEIAIIALLLIVSAITYIKQGDSKILRISLMFIAAKNIQTKRLFRFLSIAFLGLLIIIPILCIFGGVGIVSAYGTFGIGREAATRYMLGFDGPNRLSGVWLCLLASLYMVLGKRKLTDIIYLVVTIFLYGLNKSRTGLIAGLIIIMFPYIYNYGPKIVKIIIQNNILKWTLFAIFVITVFATVAYGPIMERMNFIFNNRMSFLSRIYQGENITLWGSDFDFQEVYQGGMDNSYFNILYTNGLVVTVIYVAALLKYINILRKKNGNIIELSIALSFIVIAFVQEMIDVPFINYMYFLFILNWKEMMKSGIRLNKRVRYVNNKKDKEIMPQIISR